MQIIDIEQDSPEWHRERYGSAGGSDVRNIVPMARGGDPSGFWDLIGQRLTKRYEDMEEKPTDRGHRLEEEAVLELQSITGLPFKLKPGLWRFNEYMHLSPDGAEDGEKPKYAAEVKCLKPGKHFKYLYQQEYSSLTGIDLVPNEYGSYYREQALDYFECPSLETLFFVLYLPEAIYQKHRLMIIAINRKDIEEELAQQREAVKQQINRMKQIINRLIGDNF